MKGWLKYDSPIMQLFAKVFNFMWLNILTIVFSLPIVTAGASFTAMHYILLRMAKKEDVYITKTFFRVWKENLKQGIALWLIDLAAFAFCYLDFTILKSSKAPSAGYLRGIILVVSIVVFSIVQYEFPLLARYDNTVWKTINNATILAIGYLGRTIIMTAATLLFWAFLYRYLLYIFPLAVACGFTLPGYIDALLYKKIFEKLDQQAGAAA